MVRRILVGASVLVAALVFVAPSASVAASVHGKVGPHQYFGASVNGELGIGTPATIRMACFGPIILGETGHPLPGQTVEVERSLAGVDGVGFTGSRAKSISVFFGAPPPSVVSAGAVTFVRYGVAQPIPTSLLLPCSGSSTVSFVPLPMSPPTSRDAVVRVNFVSVGLTAIP
jgi:hypothetical protein